MEKNLLRKLSYTVILFAIIILPCFSGYAQSRYVTGKVAGADDNKPMMSVTVKVKGLQVAASTDINGNFSIEAKTGDVLVFSYIGYQNKEVTVGSARVINVVLTVTNSNLNEVVVIGYGKLRRKDVTGSISSISAKDIVEAQPTTFDQALQGKVAGVIVQQVSGQPGGDVNIQIRGIGGFNESPPLYVIDGVQIPPYGESPSTSGAGSNSTNPNEGSNPLSSIDPSQIASIDILKDASATAIYGSQASNGVVIITTKRGAAGTPTISYDGYNGWQSLPKYYDVMNLPEYATFMNEKSAIIGYDLRPEFANPQYLGQGTNWQKALFRTAPMQNHNVAITGGDARTKYYISATYFSQEGIALGSDFSRTSIKANIDNQTTDWLKVGISLSLAHVSEDVTTSNQGVILEALNQTPDVAVKNPDGTWGGNDPNIYGAYGANPFAIATIVTDHKSRYQGIGNAYAEIQFTKDLNFRNEVSGNFDFATEDYFDPTFVMGSYTNTTNRGTSTSAQNIYNAITSLLNYSHTFASKYFVSATLGHEAQLFNNSAVSASRTNFPGNDVTTINTGDATTATNSGSKSDAATEAYFARANFTYNDKYLLTGTIRHDGTSKIGPLERWNTSYSGAFAWKIMNEDFMKGVKGINDLKLRLGYGLVNNQNISNYAYGSTLTTVATGLSGISQLTSSLGNPTVQWETSKSYNLGLDVSVLNSRIQLTADAYYRKTNNLLLSLNLPYYSGTYANGGYSPGAIQAPYVNIGAVSNKGFEFSLSTYNVKSKDFNWKSTFVFSRNINKILALNPGTPAIYGTYTKSVVGGSIGEFYGYQTLGIYKNAADFAKYPAVWQNGSGPIPITPGSGGVWVGDVIFKDNNHDGKIDANDEAPLGSPLPNFQYGINNTFNYKQFDLTVFMSGEYGNKIFNQVIVNGDDPNQNFGYLQAVSNYARIGLITPVAAGGSASDINNVYITNPSTNITRISQSSGDQNTIFSDRYIQNGSFLKCKSIALGYNFNRDLISKLHIASLRVYANVSNVFTITKYQGYDPEIGSWNPLAAGIDNGYYAQPRVISIGADISLK